MGNLPAISGQVPGDHRHVPVTQALFPDKLLNPVDHAGSLLGRAGSLVQLQGRTGTRGPGSRFLLPLILYLPVPEQVLLQKCQLRRPVKPRPLLQTDILQNRNPVLLCQGRETAHHLVAHVEQILHACRTPQLQQPVLNRREAGEAVQGHFAALKHFRPGQNPAQHIQHFLRRNVVTFNILPEGLKYHREILQLLPEQGGACVLGHFPQHLGGDSVLVELGDHGFQLSHESALV